MPESIKSNQVVFGLKAQAAVGTPLDDVDITHSVVLKKPAYVSGAPDIQTDEDEIKGVEFATRHLVMAKNSGFSIECDWDSVLLGLLLTLMFKDSTPAQPDAQGNPLAYDHTIIPSDLQDPESGGAAALTTTAILKQTSDILDKLQDLAVSEITLKMDRNLMLTGGATFVGSGVIDEPGEQYELPAVAEGSFIWSNQGAIENESGDISVQLKSVEIRCFQDIIMDDFKVSTDLDDRGVRDRLDFSKRGIEVSMDLIVEGGKTERDKLLDNDFGSFEMELLGELIAAEKTARHGIKLTIPKCYYSAYDMGDDQGRLLAKVKLTVVDDQETGYPFQFIVHNGQASYPVDS